MSPPRVLLVNDDADLRSIFVDMVEDWGYHIHAVPNGQAAIDALTDGYNPRVIFLDLLMPVMSGQDFVRWLRGSQYSAIPIVVVSCSSGKMMAEIAHEVAEVLPMPYGLEFVQSTLERYCGPAENDGATDQP